MSKPRPDYGIDAPVIVQRLAAVGAATVVVAVVLRATGFGISSLVVGAVGLWSIAGAVVMIAGSRVGEFRLRDALLSRIVWRGDERVLDVGCGHGLLLVAAAKRLSTGRAVGIDIWSQTDQADQADNQPERTAQNARLEGVADRASRRTACLCQYRAQRGSSWMWEPPNFGASGFRETQCEGVAQGSATAMIPRTSPRTKRPGRLLRPHHRILVATRKPEEPYMNVRRAVAV